MMLFLTTVLVLFGAASAHLVVSDAADMGFRDFVTGKIRFAIYKINDENILVEEFRGLSSSTYADFITDLRKTNPNECRYGILDFEYVENGQPKKNLVNFVWLPETASKEQVLLYALEDKISTIDHYGLKYYVVAHTDADLDEKTVASRIKKYSEFAAQVAKNQMKEANQQ